MASKSKSGKYELPHDAAAAIPAAVSVRHVLIACAIAVPVAMLLIGGGTVILAADAWLQALIMIPLLVIAAMSGLAVTWPIARAAEKNGQQLFADSPWPAGFRMVVSLAAGLGAVSLITLALGSAGKLFAGLLLAALLPLCLLGIAGLWQMRRQGCAMRAATTSRKAWFALLAAVPVAAMLIMASFPPGFVWSSEGNGYDVLEYHLELPKEYVAAHSTAPVMHNIYSFMPSLTEMLYSALGAATSACGNFYSMVYASQYLHLFMTILAGVAILLAPIKLNLFGRIAGCVLLLATPWAMVVGSLAYNDGAMMLFGALALILAMTEPFTYRGVLVGVMLGLAISCKLTAGVMFALPVGLLMLSRGQWRAVIAATLLAAVIFAPWCVRAYAASGNPVFPVAMRTFGAGHLSPELAEQFIRGHQPRADQQDIGGRLSALAEQSLLNTQWSPGLFTMMHLFAGGGINPSALARMGIMWPLMLVLVIMCLRQRMALWLWGVMLAQIVAWLFLTHLQARFLLPVLPVLALLIAAGCDRAPVRWFAGAVVSIQVLCALLVPYAEAGLFCGPAVKGMPQPYLQGVLARESEALMLPNMYLEKEAAEKLDHDGKVYLVGLATPLFYNQPVIYNTVFDHNPLAQALSSGGPAEGIRMLREKHVRYVVVSWSEIDRLRRTYGYPDAITRESFEKLTRAGLRQMPTRFASIEMYEVKE